MSSLTLGEKDQKPLHVPSTLNTIRIGICWTLTSMLFIKLNRSSILYLIAFAFYLVRMRCVTHNRISCSRTSRRPHGLQISSSVGNYERTEVTIRPTDWKIDHTTPIHLVGSCFTDTISTSLKRNKFNCFSNGQGIMFNPISISTCLNNVIKCESFHNLSTNQSIS